jgi:hypothetical protein
VFEYSFDKKERKMIDEQQNITNFANIKSIGIRKKTKKKQRKEYDTFFLLDNSMVKSSSSAF